MIFSPKRYRYRNMRKSNLNYNQAKRKYPKLNPFGDADRDGVMNMFDCRPFNRRRQDEHTYVHIGKPMESKKFDEYRRPGGWFRVKALKEHIKEPRHKQEFSKKERDEINKMQED